MGARNYKDYSVWNEAVDYATLVYKTTTDMPWFEKRGLSDQLQRAVVSISSNIAEGCARPSDSDFVHFLDIALGSTYEVQTQLLVAKNIGYLDDNSYESLFEKSESIARQLSGLIKHIRQK